MASALRTAALGALLCATGCVNFWEAYEDPKYASSPDAGKALPEPSFGDLVRGMIQQSAYVAVGQRDRFAVRRCVYVEGLPDRCEITVVGGRAVLAGVPTFRRGGAEWEAQGEDAEDAVEDAVERLLGERRVALTPTGVFGAKFPDEGRPSAKLENGRLKLFVIPTSGETRLVFETEAPPGVSEVTASYLSERAPDVYGFALAGPEIHHDRNNGFVAFRRLGPLQYQLVAWLPPMVPNPPR